METKTLRPLLTRAEVAAILRVKPHTLACWAVQARGPPMIKIGRLAMYATEDVDNFIYLNRRGGENIDK